jgi:hypothetical protein
VVQATCWLQSTALAFLKVPIRLMELPLFPLLPSSLSPLEAVLLTPLRLL